MRDGSSVLEGRNNLQHEGRDVVLQFADLGVEANRIAYVEAMVGDRIVAAFDADANRLELAFLKLPRRTMNEVVATAAKLSKACSERAAFVLNGFEGRYIAQSGLQRVDPTTQG